MDWTIDRFIFDYHLQLPVGSWLVWVFWVGFEVERIVLEMEEQSLGMVEQLCFVVFEA